MTEPSQQESLIRLKDNTPSTWAEARVTPDSENEKTLRFLASTSINSLTDKHKENLLIFPHCLNDEHRDLEGNDTILSLRDEMIHPSNYMGFLGRGQSELLIRSRFDESNYLLHYMLQRVFAINVMDMDFSQDKESIWDFLIYLFPYYLKKALRQGLFKEYQRRDYNDAKIKGPINISQHINKNVPFTGRVAYSTREYCYDNKITQLIRHTIELIRQHRLGGQNVLFANADTRQAVQKMVEITPTYSRFQRQAIISKNLKRERHPYFSEYALLQKLCLQILRHEKNSFGQDKQDKIHGLLFDGAWLWEEYLHTVLKPLNFQHPRNKEGTGKIYLFQDSRSGIRYPDFYQREQGIVLDAKYKRASAGSPIAREDLHQLITYMHCLPATVGALLYPSQADSPALAAHHYGQLNGYAGDIYQCGLQIVKADNYKAFCAGMNESENTFCNQIQQIIKQTAHQASGGASAILT